MRGHRLDRRIAARRVIAAAAALAVALAAAGCASMFAPGPDMVPVNSRPEGARVAIDGVPVGRTPCTVAFTRSGEGVVSIDSPGYEPATVDRDKVVNGMVFLNLLWGLASPVAFGIDLASSNQGKYSTTPVYVELTPKTVTPSDGAAR
jgi:hypothetical protein